MEVSMNKDELKGKGKQIKGDIKQRIGNATGDNRLRDEGTADELEGNVQNKFGEGRRKVGDAVKDLGNKIKR
jgi:uncharacterized protein YjbJ (UPF0337 family)